jgi:hypothetical protein
VQEELSWLEQNASRRQVAASLLTKWLALQSSVDIPTSLLIYLNEHERWRTLVPKEDLVAILQLLPPHALKKYPSLAGILVDHRAESNTDIAADVDYASMVTNLVLDGFVPGDKARRVAVQIAMRVPSPKIDSYTQQFVSNQETCSLLYERLCIDFEPTSFGEMLRWFSWFGHLLSDQKVLEVFCSLIAKSQQNADGYTGTEREACIRLLEGLLNRPEIRIATHRSFLSVAPKLRHEAVEYCMVCLNLIPPQISLAEDALAQLLQLHRCSELLADLEQAVLTKKYQGKSERLDRAFDMNRIMAHLSSLFADRSRIEHYHLEHVLQVCRVNESCEGADMAAAVFEQLRRLQKTSWVTPISFHFQALVYAHRLEEAKLLLQQYPNTTVGPRSAALPAQNFLKRFAVPERTTPSSAEDYRRIAVDAMRTWSVFCQ